MPSKTMSCSVPGCAEKLSVHQIETTEHLFGKPYCIEHEKIANEEAAKASELFTVDTKPYVDCGFKIENGLAVKVIGQAEVTVDFTKVSQGVAKKFCIQVGGYDYEYDLNQEVDAEIKKLFLAIEKKGAASGSKKDKKEQSASPAPEKKAPEKPLMPLDENKYPTPKPEPKQAEVVEPEKAVMAPIGTPEGNRQRNLPVPDARIPVQTFSPQGSMIKGMQPSLKEIGKIKIGRKGEVKTSQKGTQYRPPQKFDHFEIVTVIRDEKTGDFIPDPIMQTLGDKPKELNVMCLYNDVTLNFLTWYAAYKGGKCLCRGDGKTAKNVAGDEFECNPETCETFKEKGCKPNGILSVILTDSPRLGGVYKFRTTSFNSIRSILSSLFFIRSLTGGVLAMIPLKLTVSPQTVQPKDSQTAQTIYVVNIEFAGTAQKLLETTVEVSKYQGAMRAQIAELEQTARLSLAAPESEEEIKDVQAEFYPDTLKEEVK